jgi:hypothetical protein
MGGCESLAQNPPRWSLTWVIGMELRQLVGHLNLPPSACLSSDRSTNLTPSCQYGPERASTIGAKVPVGSQDKIGGVRLNGVETRVRIERHLADVDSVIALVHVDPDMIEPCAESLGDLDNLIELMRGGRPDVPVADG